MEGGEERGTEVGATELVTAEQQSVVVESIQLPTHVRHMLEAVLPREPDACMHE